MTYLLLQVVGFCLAVIVNAMFALACRSSRYLPPIETVIYAVSFLGMNGDVDILPKQNASPGDSFSSLYLVLEFYITYASIRVFFGFGQSILTIALQSVKDFPEAAKVLSNGGMYSLNLVPLVFLPVLSLEVVLLSSDLICVETLNSEVLVANNTAYNLCHYSGIYYLSSKFPRARKICIYSLIVLVVQLWQTMMHQFPRWDQAFRRLSNISRILYQLSIICLTIMTFYIMIISPFSVPRTSDTRLVLTLLGWTVWLFTFYPHIKNTHGRTWEQRVTTESLQHLAAYLRLSLMTILGIIFFHIGFSNGFLEAQLDLTFITIVLPVVYCSLYLIALVAIKAESKLFFWSCLYSITSAIILTRGLWWYFPSNSNTSSISTYGQGSVILVFFHIFNAVINFFSHNPSDDYDPDDVDVKRNCIYSVPTEPPLDAFDSSSENFNAIYKSPPSNAELLLSNRGKEHSTLVTLGLPKELNDHWLVSMSKRILAYFLLLTRYLLFADSFLSGVIMVFVTFAAMITTLMWLLTIGSLAQNILQLFPITMSYKLPEGREYVHFDHLISNVTLFVNQSNSIYSSRFNHLNTRNSSNTCDINGGDKYIYLPNEKPSYAACSWKSNDLSLLDYAFLSQLAYFDEEGNNSLQILTDYLFPHRNFSVKSSLARINSSGPVYVEFHDNSASILAVRGTDVGRLNDVLEDIKLYAEPVIFTLLSAFFPSIRLWTHDTMSIVIEWLYEFNSFFGLQGEAEYYQPLVRRVLEIRDEFSQSGESHSIIITGHSLGGGLARIVGTLTEVPSVSFSPPGLGLSFRKYSAFRGGKSIKISSGSAHYETVAVVTELDLISQIDEQVGMVQKIICNDKDNAHANSCHAHEGTICNLLRHCGDTYNRFVGCQFSYSISTLFPSVTSFLLAHAWIFFPMVLSSTMMVTLAIVPEFL